MVITGKDYLILKANVNKNPESVLKALVGEVFNGKSVEEYRPFSERAFRVDVAVPELKIAFECDGWQFHGKDLKKWKKEKFRDRFFLKNGWKVFRWPAMQIKKETELVKKEIIEIKELFENEQG